MKSIYGNRYGKDTYLNLNWNLNKTDIPQRSLFTSLWSVPTHQPKSQHCLNSLPKEIYK